MLTENKSNCTTLPRTKTLDAVVDALQEGLAVLVVVSMVSVVATVRMMFVILLAIGVIMAMVLSGFILIVQFALAMKHGVVSGVTEVNDVELTGPVPFRKRLDEWHTECVAECIGQADGFLAQRASTKAVAKAFVFVFGRRDDGNNWADGASDVVIVAVDVGVCQRMAKTNVVGIRIEWALDDADRLRSDEADYGTAERKRKDLEII